MLPSRLQKTAAMALGFLVLISLAACRRGIVVRGNARILLPSYAQGVPTTFPSMPGLPSPAMPSPAATHQGNGSGNSGGSNTGGSSQQPVKETSGTDLPNDFPSFPLPQKAAPVHVVVDSTGSRTTRVQAWFGGPDTSATLKTYFESNLPSAGWTVNAEHTLSGPMRDVTVFSISRQGWVGTVTIGEGFPAAAGYEGVFEFFVGLYRTG